MPPSLTIIVAMAPSHPRAPRPARVRPPLPIVVVLVVLLAAGPLGLLASRGHTAQPARGPTLGEVAKRAGCTLREFEDDMRTNPAVTGRFVERIRADDGSYAGKPPPPPLATIHALFHGRVLFQYRPGIGAASLEALDRLVSADGDSVLLFENQTGMRVPVAATAYLSLMTCPRVDRSTLRALASFRDRRRAFGQAP